MITSFSSAQNLMKKCSEIYNEADCALIGYALKFAIDCHEGQKRESGEPYVEHPIAAADILVDLGMDVPCICAALLHDVVEDTSCDRDTLKKKFGEEIAVLVDAVTKLSKLKSKFTTQIEAQAENLRKLFFAISKDLRVLFIKLADRLHNMRTLDALKPEKQLRIARETLEIYAPMAARLGIAQIKSELEDLSMKYLYPTEYKYLAEQLDIKREERMREVKRIAEIIQNELEAVNIKADIKGRPKHFYSIYKKMVSQNKTLDQIYDLIAVRVIVDDVKECYTVLGIIHSMWKPVPGRFKDYIAMPKPNLYQSLHTTVVSNFGRIFEIQIRTHEMNKIAEYGIAAHWKYKEGRTEGTETDIDKRLSWVREVMEAEEDIKDSREYLKTLKLNIVSNEIYVFSPKGEVFDLPVGSTAVDFAYKVHTEVGNKCVGARVNNKMVPLNTVLNTGDVIEIITSNASKEPSRDWLKFVVTPQARSKIRAFFKKDMALENLKLGKDMLEKEAKRRGYKLSELMAQQAPMDEIMRKYSFQTNDDLFSAVGFGSVNTNQILLKLIDRFNKARALSAKESGDDAESEPVKKSNIVGKKSPSGVIVEGFGDFLVKLAKCCNPVPGDSIVGYAMRGAGVSIHRTDCPNIRNMETERLMEAHWENTDNSTFVAKLRLECVDRTGLINALITLISNQGLSIQALELHVQKGIAYISMGIEIKSISELDFIIKKLSALPDVISVKRT